MSLLSPRGELGSGVANRIRGRCSLHLALFENIIDGYLLHDGKDVGDDPVDQQTGGHIV